MKLIVRIIIAAVGAVIIWLSLLGLMDAPQYKDIIGSAVYLDEPVLRPENEGKMVVIHGNVEMTAPAYDEELGLTIDSVKAYRYAERYAQTSAEKSIYKYNWVADGSETIVGKASLGEFALDEETLAGFPADDSYTDFDPDEIGKYNITHERNGDVNRVFVLVNADYYYDEHEYSINDPIVIREEYKSIADERTGARAYNYRAYDASRHEEMTIAGIQQGSTLAAHEKLGPVVFSGALTLEEVLNAESGYLVFGSLAFLVLGAGVVLFAILWRRKK